MAARFPEISGEEIQQLAQKAVNKYKVKTTKSWAESRGLNNDIVKYLAKELDECLSRFFAEIRSLADYEEGHEAEQRQISSIISAPVCQQGHNSHPVRSSLPIPQNQTATPNSSPPLSWLSGDDKLRSWHWCFSTKQELNTGRSLPVPYLNLWFRFTVAVTAEAMIYKLLSLNSFTLFALNALFHKKTVNHFLHWRRKVVTKFVFSTVKIKVYRVLLWTNNSMTCTWYLATIPARNISKFSKYYSLLCGSWYFGQFWNITHSIIGKYKSKSCYYLYIYPHVIPKFGINNMWIFSHVTTLWITREYIPKVVTNMGKYPHVIPKVVNTWEYIPMLLPKLLTTRGYIPILFPYVISTVVNNKGTYPNVIPKVVNNMGI